MKHLLEILRDETIITEITVRVTGVSADPDDDHVLAAAASASVDFLVTGDHQLRALDEFDGVRLVTPLQFLDILKSAGDYSN